MTPMIRAIAICLLFRDDDLLVVPYCDAQQGEQFYRPPGGAIHFGESSLQAVHRELEEELEVVPSDVTSLGVIEDFYRYSGAMHHQHVFVFHGEPPSSLYERDCFTFEDDGVRYNAIWKPIASFSSKERLVPAGLSRFLCIPKRPRIISKGFDS